MNKRLHIYYSGQVQGVGFRYTVRSIAQSMVLKGWVRNTIDGGVELVAEGEERLLKDLRVRINQEMNYTSFSESVSWEPGTGEFTAFEIKY